jgi:hypothetical protein
MRSKKYDTPPDTPVTEAPAARPDASVPKARVKRAQGEVAELRARAARVASQSRATISLTLKIPVDVYRALVELAEEYHQKISGVAIQALKDGVRKYKDFSDPTLPSPFRQPTPLRGFAKELTGPPLSVIDRVLQKQAEEEPEVPAALNLEAIMAGLKKLTPEAIMPQAPPAPTYSGEDGTNEAT